MQDLPQMLGEFWYGVNLCAPLPENSARNLCPKWDSCQHRYIIGAQTVGIPLLSAASNIARPVSWFCRLRLWYSHCLLDKDY
jgi:hypothetical protein